MPPLLIAKTCNVQYIYSIKKVMRQQALAYVKQHTLCLKKAMRPYLLTFDILDKIVYMLTTLERPFMDLGGKL